MTAIAYRIETAPQYLTQFKPKGEEHLMGDGGRIGQILSELRRKHNFAEGDISQLGDMTTRATEELVLSPESANRPWNLNLNDLQYYRAQKNVLKGAIWQLFGLKLPRADRLVMELCLERMNQGLSRKNAGLFGDEIPADIVPGR